MTPEYVATVIDKTLQVLSISFSMAILLKLQTQSLSSTMLAALGLSVHDCAWTREQVRQHLVQADIDYSDKHRRSITEIVRSGSRLRYQSGTYPSCGKQDIAPERTIPEEAALIPTLPFLCISANPLCEIGHAQARSTLKMTPIVKRGCFHRTVLHKTNRPRLCCLTSLTCDLAIP